MEAVKLLEAEFIGETQYTTWLANVMVVKKTSGKWSSRELYTHFLRCIDNNESTWIKPSVRYLKIENIPDWRDRGWVIKVARYTLIGEELYK